MSFGIKVGRPLAQEVRRLVDQELTSAVSCLTEKSREDGSHTVHQARKHVKKARAVLQLARTALGSRYDDADDALRTANRALGPLADACRMTQLMAGITPGNAGVTNAMFQAIRLRLLARASAVEARAARDGIRSRAVRLLDSTRRQLDDGPFPPIGPEAIAAGIRTSRAITRRCRHEAARQPRIELLHRWRRRVKREWHLLRLIAAMTGDRLGDEQHQLEALDAVLGNLHDLNVLIAGVAADSPLSRPETARVLRALRGCASDLRRRAHTLAAVLDEPPRDLERRVIALWGMPPRAVAFRPGEPWRRRA